MNQCILQAQLQEKTLRHTQQGQPIAEFIVSFPAIGSNDLLETLKVLYWGERGEKAYHALQLGELLVLTGQLRITKVTHQIGDQNYPEQKASLIAEKIHRLSRSS